MVRSVGATLIAILLSAGSQPGTAALFVVDQLQTQTPDSMNLWLELDRVLRSDPGIGLAFDETEAARLRRDHLVKGRAALKRATEARLAGNLIEAGRVYAEAGGHLDQSDWRDDFEAFIEAAAWRAAFERSQPDLSRVFTARPTFTFPEGALPNELAADVELSRAGKAKAVRARFSILATGPVAVWVDGRFEGMAPLTTGPLVAGRHHVTAVAPGNVFVQAVEVFTPETPVRLVLPSLPDANAALAVQRALSAASRRHELDLELARERSRLGLDELLVVIVTGKGALVSRAAARGILHDQVGELRVASLVAAFRRLLDRPIVDVMAAPAVAPPPQRGPVAMLIAGGASVVLGGLLFGISRLIYQRSLEIPQVQQDRYLAELLTARLIGYPTTFFLMPAGALVTIIGAAWFGMQK